MFQYRINYLGFRRFSLSAEFVQKAFFVETATK
jgi:hypothetical protein